MKKSFTQKPFLLKRAKYLEPKKSTINFIMKFAQTYKTNNIENGHYSEIALN